MSLSQAFHSDLAWSSIWLRKKMHVDENMISTGTTWKILERTGKGRCEVVLPRVGAETLKGGRGELAMGQNLQISSFIQGIHIETFNLKR